MKYYASIAAMLLLLFVSYSFGHACGKISGDILYSGEKKGNIIVTAFSIPPNMEKPLRLDTLNTTGYYYLNDFDPGTYFVGAFMDVDGNGYPGLDEPVGFHPAPVKVVNDVVSQHIDITLQELPQGSGSLSGTINYVGVATGDVHVFGFGATMTPFSSDCVHWGSDNAFELNGLLNGNYIVVGFMDENGNQMPDKDEPMGAVTNLLNLGIGEHMTGLQLNLLNPEIRNSLISGNVHYSGKQQGPVIVAAAGLSHTPINIAHADPQTGYYCMPNLGNGDYLIFAFMDANQNNMFDLGEPYSETYLNKRYVDTNQHITNMDIVLVERGTSSIEGTVSCDHTGFGLITIAALGVSTTPVGLTTMFTPGHYMIENLSPGYYVVGGFKDTNLDFRPNLNEPVGFYSEDLIEVLPGTHIKNINFNMTSLSKGIISGLISVPDQIRGSVYVVSMGMSSTPFSVHVISEAGAYQVTDLAAGKYITAAFVDIDGDGIYTAGEPMAMSPRLVTVTGQSETSNVNINVTTDGTTGVSASGNNATPEKFSLLPNYPNPFNPSTTIEFEVAEATHMSIKIFNIRGEEVATLVNGVVQPGVHHVTWDASNVMNGQASGVYLCKLQAGSLTDMRKLTLIK
ncbi:T9SS type A sorting domain-containing protein [candidate division KSB1 bacterium]|nr:T9SS type A sorting domain-containing protein [candidate division KSB1 bacterium]